MMQREQRLSRMSDYARSRREAELEDGVYIYSAWAHGWRVAVNDSLLIRVVFCSATEASVVDFISK